MPNIAVSIKSVSAKRALEALGRNIKTARVKRHISINGLAERIGVSDRTIMRLEKGDAGVSIGTLAMACLVLGEIDRISEFLDDGTDDTGLLMNREALPKRIDGARKSKAETKSETSKDSSSNTDDEGVGF